MTAATSRASDRLRWLTAARITLAGVQAGELGGAQGPPQPPGLVAGLALASGGEGGLEQVAVLLLAGRGDLALPDGVQDGQVVGVGEVAEPGLGRRQFLAVASDHLGQHAERLLPCLCCGVRGRGGLAVAVRGDAVVPVEFGCGSRYGTGVGGFRGVGEDVGGVARGCRGTGAT